MGVLTSSTRFYTDFYISKNVSFLRGLESLAPQLEGYSHWRRNGDSRDTRDRPGALR